MITNEAIYSKLLNIEKQLNKLLRKGNVEEVSVNRASKLLHIGYDKMMELILDKKIKARPISKKKKTNDTDSDESDNRITYKIKIADIEEFQTKPDVDLRLVNFKPVEQIIKEASL